MPDFITHSSASSSRSYWTKNEERESNMTENGSIQICLPEDVALKIASYLEVGDLRALGSCCRFWRKLCSSDYLWKRMARERWPSLILFSELPSAGGNDDTFPKGWKGFYLKWHHEMAARVMSVIWKIDRSYFVKSVGMVDYLKAIEALNSMQLGYKDVELILFKPSISVLFNLVGLHYCIHWLDVPVEQVEKALRNSMISHRQVHVTRWKLNRLFENQDGFYARSFYLRDLASASGSELLSLLHRGAISRDFHVKISIHTSACNSWSWSSLQV